VRNNKIRSPQHESNVNRERCCEAGNEAKLLKARRFLSDIHLFYNSLQTILAVCTPPRGICLRPWLQFLVDKLNRVSFLVDIWAPYCLPNPITVNSRVPATYSCPPRP
jgi:hypothetical protein